MVEAEGQRAQHADLQLMVYYGGLLGDPAHAQDCRLGRVKDGRETVDAVGPQVGDGECAALHLIGAEPAGSGFVHQRQQVGRLGDEVELAKAYGFDNPPAAAAA